MQKMVRVQVLVLISLTLLILASCAAPSPAPSSSNQNSQPANSQPANAQPAPAATPTESEAAETGSILVETTPAGAEVMLITEAVGGAGPPEPRGTTPTTITGLAPGTYTVHLEKPGYKFFQKSVLVKEGKIASVKATMKR